jgi:hypothetical protein
MSSTAEPSRRLRRPPGSSVGGSGLWKAIAKVGPPLAFVVLPLVIYVSLIHSSGFHPPESVAFWDFHAFWGAGHDILHGRSPYPPASSAVLAHEDSFVYPAPAAIVMIPFTALPFRVSGTIFALLLLASIPLALRIVGVRDWRCYGIALLAAPMDDAISVDAVTPLLVLGLALLWRYRDRLWPAACAVAFVIVLKVFLWPFLLWLAFTRRLRTALLATGLIVTVTLLSWAVIGFAGLREYPDMLRILSRVLEGKGYSLVALGLSLGASRTVAEALPWLVGGAIVAVIALRGRRPGADAWTFAAATGASLTLTPISWLHYMLILFIPIAIARPRLSWLWATPLLFWVVRGQSVEGPVWHDIPRYKDLALSPRIGQWYLIVYVLVVMTLILLLAARSSSASPAPGD